MALFIQQTDAAKYAITAPCKIQTKLIHTILSISALIGMLSLSACQTAPTTVKTSSMQTFPSVAKPSTTKQPSTQQSVTKQPEAVTQAPIVKSDGYENPTEPYTPPTQSPVETQSEVIILTPSREDYIIPESSIPSHSELLELARQNSKQRSQQSTTNNSNLPAFRNLMQVGTGQLQSGNLSGAESSFTRAQRLAPKSSAVYFYLAQVALKKNQPRKAEAMARRGLTVSQDNNRRRALWQIILQSGQAQGNARVIKEAKQALR
ncbi:MULTISPECIES: M48 family metallopeptidase [unclassified Psychrobacter]|uniref:tetratricopeptide repeat protein n=1 Tax=unclassified Psychrobacter TaxID=196806 RepID=UPI0025E1D1BF|nr:MULTISPECIES: tetratricopeptide repeat protein [unclassified Psychrobacter]